MSKPTVAIVGASNNRSKFGNKAVRAHIKQGYEVYPVNPKEEMIEGLKCYSSLNDLPVDHLTRISIYVPPTAGIGLLEKIQKLNVDEVWFNPGSESLEILTRAEELGIDIIQACSIVDLGVSPASFPEN